MTIANAIARPSAPAAELTLRALVTGVVLGAALTPCNVYTGLKIGWSFNMSITAGLLGAGLWRIARQVGGASRLGLLENNINQTTTSSAASIISGGLVAPIPALTLLTGQTLGWPELVLWVFAVSALGIVVAAGLRGQMIEREGLRFPAGVATAETMRRIHEKGAEAAERLRVLASGAVISAVAKVAVEVAAAGARLAPPVSLPAFGALRAALPGGASFANLGFSLDPSLLMVGFGAIIGFRAGASLLIGAVVAWGGLASFVLAQGWIAPGAADAMWFQPLVAWLLWPGVTLIVVSALVSFALSVARVLPHVRPSRWIPRGAAANAYILFLAATAALVAVTALSLFGIALWESLLAVALSFVLAVVAARVTGETGITPIGALGKITQLTFGVVTPGDATANLMTANVTGGAAGQCADLMHDLKTGHIIGATPRHQIVAQAVGVLTGSLAGVSVYLILVPDPAGMLLSPDWPAPAVATWKAVAEVLSGGLQAIPTGAVPAMAAAAIVGTLLAIAERLLPERHAQWLPCAPAMGLAFVIPAWNSISLFLGALAAAVLGRLAPDWAERKTTPLAAGLVAGESLVGVGVATWRMVA